MIQVKLSGYVNIDDSYPTESEAVLILGFADNDIIVEIDDKKVKVSAKDLARAVDIFT